MGKVFKVFGAALERMNTYVQEHGGRYSSVREMVLEHACMLPQPFTAEQLEVSCQSEKVASGTIYNCLQLFLAANIIHATKRQKGHQATEYELITGNQNRMQRICQKCGSVANFRAPLIDQVIREHKTQSFFMQHYTLFVYGVCRKCKVTEMKNKKKSKT